MANKWSDWDKFVVIEGGAVVSQSAAEYSSSNGFVGTLPNGKHTPAGSPIRSEGVSFGGRYEDPRIAKASGSVNWGAYNRVSQSRNL